MSTDWVWNEQTENTSLNSPQTPKEREPNKTPEKQIHRLLFLASISRKQQHSEVQLTQLTVNHLSHTHTHTHTYTYTHTHTVFLEGLYKRDTHNCFSLHTDRQERCVSDRQVVWCLCSGVCVSCCVCVWVCVCVWTCWMTLWCSVDHQEVCLDSLLTFTPSTTRKKPFINPLKNTYTLLFLPLEGSRSKHGKEKS